MDETRETIVLLRTAIALSKFLEELKAKGSSHARIANNTDYLINSYGKIALETGFKKNTVGDIFNGRRSAKIPTIALILEAMNKTMSDFGKAYDRITDSDIQKFKERSNSKITTAAAKKKARK